MTKFPLIIIFLFFFRPFSELEKVNSVALSASDLACWISNEVESPEEKIGHRIIKQQDQERKEEAWFLPPTFSSTMMIIGENLILERDVSLIPTGKYN